MYIKIYFDNKPLFLCDEVDESLQPYVHHDDTVFIDELDAHTVKSMIHEMQNPVIHAGVFFNENLENLKSSFFKKFKLVQAAGGFVQNEKNEVLMMFRRGKWDLPKGKLDKNESLEHAAVRETEEETGLNNLIVLLPIITTFHTYQEGTKSIIKETTWYKMRAPGDQILIPQASEQITELSWVAQHNLEKYKDQSYSSVIDVLDAGFAL